jgi:uncharacterized coiled-coil DUF342 family protein
MTALPINFNLSDEEREERQFQEDIRRSDENKRQREIRAREEEERKQAATTAQIAYYTTILSEKQEKLVQLDTLINSITEQLANAKDDMRAMRGDFDELFQRVVNLAVQQSDQEKCRFNTQFSISRTEKEIFRLRQ